MGLRQGSASGQARQKPRAGTPSTRLPGVAGPSSRQPPQGWAETRHGPGPGTRPARFGADDITVLFRGRGLKTP